MRYKFLGLAMMIFSISIYTTILLLALRYPKGPESDVISVFIALIGFPATFLLATALLEWGFMFLFCGSSKNWPFFYST